MQNEVASPGERQHEVIFCYDNQQITLQYLIFTVKTILN